MTNEYSYFEALNMSRALYGLGPLGAGTASGLNEDFETYVGGGTAICVGLPLALKGGKAVIWDVPKWAVKNRGNYSEAFKTTTANWKAANLAKQAKNQAFINGIKGNGFLGGIRNINSLTKLEALERSIPTDKSVNFDRKKYEKLKKENPEKAEKYLKKFKEAKEAKVEKINVYKEAKEKVKRIKEGIKSGKLKGKDLQKAVLELDKAVAEADKAALSIKAKPTSKLAKFKNAVSKYSGAKAANAALTKGAASNTKAVRVASKGAKNFVKGGGALTAAVEFGFEVPEIIQTFRECGSTAGWKQVGKSATVAVASGVGYAAGAWAGGKVGAAAGAAIGSVVPGIGNAVGAVVGGAIGIACGLIGSWLCSKGARKLVGKSEIEKKKEQESTQVAIDACKDSKNMEELVLAYEQMINERDQMVQEGIAEDEVVENTNDIESIENSNPTNISDELDRQLAALHYVC